MLLLYSHVLLDLFILGNGGAPQARLDRQGYTNTGRIGEVVIVGKHVLWQVLKHLVNFWPTFLCEEEHLLLRQVKLAIQAFERAK